MPIETPLAVGDICRITFESRTDTQIGINVLFLRITDVSGQIAILETLVDDLAGFGQNIYPNILPEEAFFSGVSGQLLGLPDSYQYFKQRVSFGAADGKLLPTQTSPVIQKQSGLAGRKNRGRMYMPFPPDTFLGELGRLTIDGIQAYITIADAFNEKSRWESGAAQQGTFTWTLPWDRLVDPVEIRNFVVTGKFGTQRRRGQYGKSNT